MAEIGDQFLIGGRKLAQLKNDELKHELEKRGLKKSGNKAALIERLSEVRSSRSTRFFHCLFSTINIMQTTLRIDQNLTSFLENATCFSSSPP